MEQVAAITECSGPISLTFQVYAYDEWPPVVIVRAHDAGTLPETGRRVELFRRVSDLDALALVFDQTGHPNRAKTARAAALSLLAAIDAHNERVAVSQVARVIEHIQARDAVTA